MRRRRERGWLLVIGALAIGFVAAPGLVAWIVLGVLFALGVFLTATGRLRSPLDRMQRR